MDDRPIMEVVGGGRSKLFLEVAKRSRGFKGLPISQVMYISHLLFVDDILIFCDGSRREVEKLCQGLALFKNNSNINYICGNNSVNNNNYSDNDNINNNSNYSDNECYVNNN